MDRKLYPDMCDHRTPPDLAFYLVLGCGKYTQAVIDGALEYLVPGTVASLLQSERPTARTDAHSRFTLFNTRRVQLVFNMKTIPVFLGILLRMLRE